MTTARRQEQIVARIAAVEDEDLFGWAREVLIEGFDWKHAQTLVHDWVTREQWERTYGDMPERAHGYFAFAIVKIRDKRGISAERSVVKLREYAWLLGRDDVVTAMDEAEYAPYGEPKIRAFGAGMGWPWLVGDDLDNALLKFWGGEFE